MILYDLNGDVSPTPVAWRPRTCFLMTKLGRNVPEIALQIRSDVICLLEEHAFDVIDADSVTTGKDYLSKILRLSVEVPLGVAIVYGDMPVSTMGNVFFELGWMQALGKETLVVKDSSAQIPSDFVRTEYLTYDSDFSRRLSTFMEHLEERAEHFALMAEQVERNPLLALDYYRRSYLLSKDESILQVARGVLDSAGLDGRAKSSVEMLAANFCAKRPHKSRRKAHPMTA